MSILRAVLKVAAKDRKVRRLLINEIRKTAEGEGEEAPKAKGKGRSGPPPEGFDEYKKIVWQDGKKKVPNPNPKGREKDVTFNTAMKDKNFMKKIMKDFTKWMKAKQKFEKGPKAPRTRKPVDPKEEQKKAVAVADTVWTTALEFAKDLIPDQKLGTPAKKRERRDKFVDKVLSEIQGELKKQKITSGMKKTVDGHVDRLTKAFEGYRETGDSTALFKVLH